MRRAILAPVAALLLAAALPAAAKVTVFENVAVLPMHADLVLSGRDVFIEDGRVAAIVPHGARPIPQDAARIATGKFLMPGLAEMHSHLASPESAFDIEAVLALYLANGVTFVRGMSGHPSHIELARRIDAGEVLGPRILPGSSPLGGWGVKTIPQARDTVQQFDALGYALVKIHEQLAPDVFVAAVRAAHGAGLLTGGHVPDAVGPRRAVLAGLGSIEHMDNFFDAGVPEDAVVAGDFLGLASTPRFERARFAAFARLLAENGTAVVPTLTLFEHLLDPALTLDELMQRPELRYAPAGQVAAWRNAKAELLDDPDYSPALARAALETRYWMLRETHARGVPVLLGADSPQIFNVPGFAAHRELASLVNAGLSPYQALRSATVAVGEYLGDAAHGVIVEGGRADLLLLDANPLEDINAITTIRGVMVQGRWLDRAALDELLESARPR